LSKDIGKALLAKSETIIESWIASIRQDLDLESAKGLAYQSVRDHIPLVLEALATLLSSALTDEPQKLADNGLEHGMVRAEQGYDVAEIVKEYSLLRGVIFTVLESDLLEGTGKEVLHKVKLIDSVIDQVISLSLKSFIEARTQEIEQLHGQLILTNQELTRLVAAQKEDLSYLAHELKSPLNSIMGFSALLLQQQQKMTQGQDSSLNLKLTEKVISNGKQLLRLINDTLEISRYEAGKMQLNLESVEIKSLITAVTEAFEPSAQEKELEMILDCDRAPQEVLSDPLKLQQIITNLISNAIRYTESGTVTISCQTIEDEQWSIVVIDTGIGISLEAQAQIFEPYFRVTDKNSALSSTGLGLAIVNKLVKLLEGKIELLSELNKGSTFTVSLPLTITPTGK
jgi:signal transduction histidine kinase